MTRALLHAILSATWLVLLSAVACPALAETTSANLDIGPVPKWVKPIHVDYESSLSVEKVTQGVFYQLGDRQTRIEGKDRQQFFHFAAKALNEKGVEKIANVAVWFDPSYQTLTLHFITIHRNGQIIQKLPKAKITVLQREKDLDYLIFDGSKTANVFLDDVRVNDTVEYAYTLKGSNPIFEGLAFGQFDLQWSVPIHSIYARLLLPKGRDFYFRSRNSAPQGHVSEDGAFQEYEWSAKDVAGLRVDNDAPAWFDPYLSVQWSEFKDWVAVARWAVPLYRVPTLQEGELKAEVKRIRQEFTTPQEQVMAVLQYVQKNIRYLGVEVGVGSYAPSDPSVVLARRFGDCKDKTLLTITMLQALGIEAHAALVSTQKRRGVIEQNPSPGAFNHVLVRAKMGQEVFWIDPTRATQKGRLTDISQPNYGYALVIDSSARDLEAMPEGAATVYSRKVLSVFDSQAGMDQPVSYTVISLYEGVAAEEFRNVLTRDSSENLQKNYLNYFARFYPGITLATPFTVNDNLMTNQMTLTESYLISDFWTNTTDQKFRRAQVEVPELYSHLRPPDDLIRNAPFALRYQADFTQTTKVLLPLDWKIKPYTTHVNDPAFEFVSKMTSTPRSMTMINHFRSLKDHVAAVDMAKYVANLKRAREALRYQLSKPVSEVIAIAK